MVAEPWSTYSRVVVSSKKWDWTLIPQLRGRTPRAAAITSLLLTGLVGSIFTTGCFLQVLTGWQLAHLLGFQVPVQTGHISWTGGFTFDLIFFGWLLAWFTLKWPSNLLQPACTLQWRDSWQHGDRWWWTDWSPAEAGFSSVCSTSCFWCCSGPTVQVPKEFGNTISPGDQNNLADFACSFRQRFCFADPGYSSDLDHVEGHTEMPVTFSETPEGLAIKNGSFKLYAIKMRFLNVFDADSQFTRPWGLASVSQPLCSKDKGGKHGNPFSYHRLSCAYNG